MKPILPESPTTFPDVHVYEQNDPYPGGAHAIEVPITELVRRTDYLQEQATRAGGGNLTAHYLLTEADATLPNSSVFAFGVGAGAAVESDDPRLECTLIAGIQRSGSNAWSRVATRQLNGTRLPSVLFSAVIERGSSAYNVECKLVDRTLAADVAGSTLTMSESDLGPTLAQATVALPAGTHLYDVWLRLTAEVPQQTDTCGVSSAWVTAAPALEI